MRLISPALLVASLATTNAGTVLWDGRFNDLTSSADLDDWSWSNQVGPYQYYIHGSGNVTEYVNLSPSYKNPADSSSEQGVKITLDSTAYWEGQTMRRTELIPQTSAAIGSGKVWYHFSLMTGADNPPSAYREHQIAFFESHFTEMKYGWVSGESGESDDQLRWFANSESQWNATMEAGVWHNCAYEIDFDAGTVAFWHSTGSDALTKAVEAVTASVSSNGADWHVGVLELARDGYDDTDEDFYFSGVYIESGDINTAFSGSSGSSAVAASSAVASSSAVAATSSSAAVIETSSAAAVAAATTSSSAAAVVVAASSSAASSVAAVSTSAAAETSVAATSAAPATTLAASASSSCVKRTKTVYVTMSA